MTARGRSQSPYETYSQWEHRRFCDNASRRGRGVSVTPQCHSGHRELDVTVIYHPGKYGNVSMVLCKACTKRLKSEARRHGYKVHTKKHTGGE
jgi:hypothetical protein